MDGSSVMMLLMCPFKGSQSSTWYEFRCSCPKGVVDEQGWQCLL